MTQSTTTLEVSFQDFTEETPMKAEYILVVEDDAALAEGIQDMLELSQYKVQIATNGRDAIEKISQRPPDLIVSDVMMPEIDGFTLLQRIRANPSWISIPFIFLTAKKEKQDIRHGFAMGAEDYLPKPFDWDDLKVAVRARLDRAQQIQDIARLELKEMKTRIINMLNHEFRTPLTYITGYAELIQADDLSPQQMQRFLKGLQSGSARLGRLIDDFLTLIAFETNDAQEDYLLMRDNYCDWQGMIQRAFQRYADDAAKHKVKLSYKIAEDLPRIWLSARQIEDVIERLVSNAIKFSLTDPGEVQVTVAEHEGGVQIAVSDQGIGIPAMHLPRIFEPFYQVDRDVHEQQGAGVGLAIAKYIVDLHGGRIEVDTEEGKGSTFTIVLPMGEPPA
jgi:signal transduction histidine kinase